MEEKEQWETEWYHPCIVWAIIEIFIFFKPSVSLSQERFILSDLDENFKGKKYFLDEARTLSKIVKQT